MTELHQRTYKIVMDECELQKFIDWLPELQSHETFYCCLFARSKYAKGLVDLPHIRSDKAQLKRFTATKANLLSKIKQLEVPFGSYHQKEIKVPQEALALYITINPRNMKLAAARSAKKLIDLITQDYNGYNPHQEVMSEIQRAKTKSQFVSFDFDMDKHEANGASAKLIWLAQEISQFLNDESFNIIETRGGAHVVVRTALIPEDLKKSWYHKMAILLQQNSDDNNNKGDIMLPVPGTYQGGFSPYFFK